MATIPVKDANGVIVPLEKPLIPGQTTMANSRPVVIANDQTAIPISGSVTISGTATISGTVAATQSGAWTVAQSGTWSVRNQDGSGNALTSATRGAQQALSVQIVDASGAQITSFGGTGAVTQSGVWSVRIQDGAGSLLTSATRGAQQALSVQIVDASGAQITAFGGSGAVTQSGVWTVQPGNTANTTPWLTSISQGGSTAAVKAGSAPPVAGDPALVVAISPNSQNPNGQATMANSSPVVLASNQSSVPTIAGGSFYQNVAASSTGTVIQSSAGAVGDYLEQVLCIVATPATSQVMVGDGVAPATVILPNAVGGGVGTYPIPCGWKSKTGSWRITTGAGVSVIASGTFS